ncbi:hypothetical protein [Algihabitans albus]|uniref:hypothetical protein n=1 Tax=Algihabitans albus TaxID=2164067 RepID=UPI000E5CAAE8|nr:hypothetical protein [Algihabitans albus]
MRCPDPVSRDQNLTAVENPPPGRNVTVKSLTVDRVDQAFPLIQAIAPGITLEEWQAFAQSLLGGATDSMPAPGGILIAEDERGYIAGLVAYRVQRDLLHGPVLVAEHFIAFDFFERDRIADALARALEGLAAGHRCAAIHTVLPDGIERARRQWLVEMLEHRGHAPHCFALQKPMMQKCADSKSLSMPQTT